MKPHTTPKPVEPIPPTPPGETMLSILLECAGEIKELGLTVSTKPIDPKQYPDWFVREVSSGEFVAVRLLN